MRTFYRIARTKWVVSMGKQIRVVRALAVPYDEKLHVHVCTLLFNIIFIIIIIPEQRFHIVGISLR